jgi:predicted amidohydrolase YtcJ
MPKTFLPWLLLPALAACASQRPANLVFRNGPVYTMATATPRVASVAVAQGRIVYAGSESGLARWIGPRTRVIDLGGRTLLPGFHDSHVHLVEGGIALSECRLSGLATQEEVLAAVRRCAAQSPGSGWLRGSGWELPVFPGANPHKSLLDAAVPDRPALLMGADGHSAWANSRALALAGITRDTPDPPRGRIERDADGEPSGTLREGAVGLLSRAVPARTERDYLDGLDRGMREAARFGITSIQDAAVSEKDLKAYEELDRRGELTVRTVAALRVDADKGLADLPRLAALRRNAHGQRLRILAAKLFVDGVIEAHTAALLAPYLDTPGNRGPVNWEPEALDRVVAALDREGFQVHVHAIGDRAVRLSFDAFEKAIAANGRRDSRHQIAHLELIDPQDISRFRSLGVIANFQAFWAIEDAYIKNLTVPVLGPERSRWIYPLGSVARTGAVLACGSDWPVTSLNPLDAIQVGVTRRDPAAGSGPAWLPEQLVDREAMLACFTRNGAFANFEETATGTIETGKAADLIVLDRDPFTVPAAEIATIRVLLTLLDGQETWRDPERWDRSSK